MDHPLASILWAITPLQSSFEVAATVIIELRVGDCPEERADNLRLWCYENCRKRWKPLERWTPQAVRIAFESVDDAVQFRLSN